jgi:hypothetical protein
MFFTVRRRQPPADSVLNPVNPQGDKVSDVDSNSDSAWSDFSAISATDFNHGQLLAHMAYMAQLLSILKTMPAEHRTSRRMLLVLTAKQHEFEDMLKAMQSDILRTSSEGCGVPIEASSVYDRLSMIL